MLQRATISASLQRTWESRWASRPTSPSRSRAPTLLLIFHPVRAGSWTHGTTCDDAGMRRHESITGWCCSLPGPGTGVWQSRFCRAHRRREDTHKHTLLIATAHWNCQAHTLARLARRNRHSFVPSSMTVFGALSLFFWHAGPCLYPSPHALQHHTRFAPKYPPCTQHSFHNTHTIHIHFAHHTTHSTLFVQTLSSPSRSSEDLLYSRL